MLLTGIVAIGFVAVLASLASIKTKLDRQITQNETIKTLLGTLTPPEERAKLQRMAAQMAEALGEGQG